MPRLWAIADLHLSESGTKPMDVFGEEWVGHAGRIARAWDASVGEEDTVLLPGDLSWGMTLRDAARDLAWFGARPGSKLLLRGNHDFWWSSLRRVRAALPPRCVALQNDSAESGGVVFVGTRGWLAPDDPLAGPGDDRVFRREVERLRLSVADADRRFGRSQPRVAMLHYPPWIEGRPPTEMVRILRRSGVSVCVYGHLHGADHALGVVGTRDGIRFHLVSCDALGFAPVEILPATGGTP